MSIDAAKAAADALGPRIDTRGPSDADKAAAIAGTASAAGLDGKRRQLQHDRLASLASALSNARRAEDARIRGYLTWEIQQAADSAAAELAAIDALIAALALEDE
jgi:hypothetical protein